MKISFEGTLSEFKSIFGGTGRSRVVYQPASNSPVDLDEKEPELVQSGEAETAPDYNFTSTDGQGADFWRDQLPVPKDDDVYEKREEAKLPPIDPKLRKEAWDTFVKVCQEWVYNFGKPDLVQPARLELMQGMGHGRYTIPLLIMAYEIKSLQRMVEYALLDGNPGAQGFDLDFIDQVACNMVQVSHMGFPDLAGTYDYSTSWRRNAPNWSQKP